MTWTLGAGRAAARELPEGAPVFVTMKPLAAVECLMIGDASLVVEGRICRVGCRSLVPRWRMPGEPADRQGWLGAFAFFPERAAALRCLRLHAEREIERWGRLLDRVKAEAEADRLAATPVLFDAEVGS